MKIAPADLTKKAFTAVLLVWCLYAALFIWRTSFVIGGERYFSLQDDAMISMRYARNLAEGNGLVWNQGGERVEGYTNPLWVLFMALIHLLPLPASKVSLVVQASGAVFLLLNLVMVKRIAGLLFGNSPRVVLPAVILTAFYLPLNNWGLQGMEVSLLTLLVSTALWLAVRSLREGRFPLGLYLLMGAGTFIRLDAAVPCAAFILFLAAADRPRTRDHLLGGGGILLAFLLLQTALRYAYYGDILPNTYYLKMTGFPLLLRLSRGFYVLLQFLFRMNVFLVLVVPGIFLFRRDREMLLPAWIFLGQVLYSVWVGGDAWEWWGGSNRYLSIAMPAFFILFAYGSARALDLLCSGETAAVGFFRRRFPALRAGFLLLALVNFNLLTGAGTLGEWLLIKKPFQVDDNKLMVEMALEIKRLTRAEARVAVVWAGAIPYFSRRPAVDLLGKNDRVIAHEQMRIPADRPPWISFFPGHLKRDYRYSLGELKPDLVAQLWGDTQEAAPYLRQSYRYEIILGRPVYLLKGSDQIRWRRVESGSRP